LHENDVTGLSDMIILRLWTAGFVINAAQLITNSLPRVPERTIDQLGWDVIWSVTRDVESRSGVKILGCN